MFCFLIYTKDSIVMNSENTRKQQKKTKNPLILWLRDSFY